MGDSLLKIFSIFSIYLSSYKIQVSSAKYRTQLHLTSFISQILTIDILIPPETVV